MPEPHDVLFSWLYDGFNDRPEWPVPEGQEALARRAANACPERVLKVVEE